MAAVDYFIKFDGIKGESTDAKHKDEIDVESWSWGETHAGAAASGGGGGRRQGLDAGLPLRDEPEQGEPRSDEGLRDGAAHQDGHALGPQGRQGPAGVPDVQVPRRPRQLVPDGRSRGARSSRPTQVSFNFAKIEVEYKPQKADGSLGSPVQFKYDLKANKTF